MSLSLMVLFFGGDRRHASKIEEKNSVRFLVVLNVPEKKITYFFLLSPLSQNSAVVDIGRCVRQI